MWTTLRIRSVTLVLPIFPADDASSHVWTSWRLTQTMGPRYYAWIGKNWRDAREKARVMTYEGSSCWPFLEVIFKNDLQIRTWDSDEALMSPILLQLELYMLWTLLGWRLDIDGLLFFASVLAGMDVTHHLQASAMPHRGSLGKWRWHAVRFVKTAQDRQYAKIKMQIVLAVGLGCERLIYTAFVKLCNCNKHEHETQPYWTASTNIPSLSTTPDKT